MRLTRQAPWPPVRQQRSLCCWGFGKTVRPLASSLKQLGAHMFASGWGPEAWAGGAVFAPSCRKRQPFAPGSAISALGSVCSLMVTVVPHSPLCGSVGVGGGGDRSARVCIPSCRKRRLFALAASAHDVSTVSWDGSGGLPLAGCCCAVRRRPLRSMRMPVSPARSIVPCRGGGLTWRCTAQPRLLQLGRVVAGRLRSAPIRRRIFA